MYDTIVVPVDGSAPAQAAAETAVQLADTFDADVSLLAVVEPSDSSPTESLPDAPGRDDLSSQWLQTLDRAAATASKADVPCETAIESGVAHTEIAAHADRVGADLVAMGTHGRTGIDRLLLGSVTERTLRTLEIPVLTIPGVEAAGADIDDIVVPTDGSPGSERAAEHACAVADAYDATVHALAVVDVQSLAAVSEGGVAISDLVSSLEAQREHHVEAVCERAEARGVPCESAVVEGTPQTAIRDYADDRDADLIAMGTHGREGVKRLFLGSVTERTVRESEVPVLAAPLAE
ncbi:hypothetical protein DJ69_16950 [Halorubrum persicum]|uniref:UspA domain-containing protein n=1 Tax=Halorubrum persicum TaxID=1383844 RepID=A0A2G1WEG9_9EURY|nr:universal stress protein [Halorubrum persicum]PHQ37388.1 hypothetical protein DJ69_16950 [Halorubrum persicum]